MSPRDRYLICQGDNGLPVQIELKKGKREGERERERGERERRENTGTKKTYVCTGIGSLEQSWPGDTLL